MDERFRRKGFWIGVGGVAIIFLCLMLCGLGALSMFATRSGPVYVQPPAGEEGAVPPSTYPGHGPLGMGWYGGWQPPGILRLGIGILTLLFFGLLLLLFLGLIRRMFWGHRWWGPPLGYKPPQGKEGEDEPHAAWGPWAWHRHHKQWGPPSWWGESEEKKPDEPVEVEE